jgi:hypothetical protein
MGNKLAWGVAIATTAAACGTVPATGDQDIGPPDAVLAGDAADVTDASSLADAAEALPGDWGPPRPLEEINAREAYEYAPTVTADGLELLFLRYVPASRQAAKLWASKRGSTSEPWGTPTELPIGGGLVEPELSPDGLELYMTSERGVFRYTRETRAGAWSARETLFEGRHYVSIADDGRSMLYTGGAPAYAILRRVRDGASGPWGDEHASGIEYTRPTVPDSVERYDRVDARGDVLLLDSPGRLDSVLAPVSQVERFGSGLWGGFRAVPRLSAARLQFCELASAVEAICAVDADLDDVPDDLVRVTREAP